MYKLLSVALVLSGNLTLNAQTWEYLEAPDVVSAVTNGMNADMLVVSDNEVYVAMGLTSVIIKKFDGVSWSDIPTPLASGNALGNIHIRKSKSSNDLYIAFANLSFSPYAYFVTVKKYDGSSWSQIGTTLQLPSGGSFFSFALDNNDTPVIIGSAQYSTQVSNVHRFEGSAWVTYPIPNSAGSTFTYNSSFVDDNNNVIFTWTKGISASLQYMHVDTLNSTGLLTTPENVIVPFSSQAFLVNNGNDFSLYNTYTDASYTLGILEIYDLLGGNWTSMSVDTVASNAFSPIGKDPNGENYSGFQSKLYNVSDFNNPLFEPAQSSLLYSLKFSQNYAYIMVNNGVVRSQLPLSSTTNLNEKISTKTNATVFPNPTNGIVYVTTENNVSTVVELYNVVGEKLSSDKIQGNTHQLNLTSYPSGVYFLKLNNKTTKIIKK